MSRRRVSFFQTEGCMETIAVIEEKGRITLGFARAGKCDIENGRISCEAGMVVALGRAQKVYESDDDVLCDKNYLRGISATRVKQGTLRLKKYLKG